MNAASLDHVFSILTGSSKRAAATGRHSQDETGPEGSSPCANTGTAGVGDLRTNYAYERFVGGLLDLLDAEQFDEARDVVKAEWDAIHGTRS